MGMISSYKFISTKLNIRSIKYLMPLIILIQLLLSNFQKKRKKEKKKNRYINRKIKKGLKKIKT